MPQVPKHPEGRMRRDEPLVSMLTTHSGTLDDIVRLARCNLPGSLRKAAQGRAGGVEGLREDFRVLAEAKVYGKQRHLEELLVSIGACAEESSIPFWQEALGPSKPRDGFAVRRRDCAVAALALLANKGSAKGWEELRAALRHPEPETRGSAVYSMAVAFRDEDGRVPEAIAAELRQAANDRASEVRFLARAMLWNATTSELPIDDPDGVFQLKVELGKATRTIEQLGSRDLYGLASDILNAFGWDHDHMWEFRFSPTNDRLVVSDDDELQPDLPLGLIGLRSKQRFAFHFDFGDDHWFGVTVSAVSQKKPRTRYPRVTEKKGKVAQYPNDDW
ncbi:MAG: hypothetical protein QM765_15865 [Myxococcales bacterium]